MMKLIKHFSRLLFYNDLYIVKYLCILMYLYFALYVDLGESWILIGWIGAD